MPSRPASKSTPMSFKKLPIASTRVSLTTSKSHKHPRLGTSLKIGVVHPPEVDPGQLQVAAEVVQAVPLNQLLKNKRRTLKTMPLKQTLKNKRTSMTLSLSSDELGNQLDQLDHGADPLDHGANPLEELTWQPDDLLVQPPHPQITEMKPPKTLMVQILRGFYVECTSM